MTKKTGNVGLLFPVLILATGVVSAQQGVKFSSVNSDGTITSNASTAGTATGPGVKSPTPAADGSAKYWDGLYTAGASTNYFTQPPYILQPPNPQIAVGPDDILTIVNRTISRYPNPNAAGNTGTLNPYNYPPTELVQSDVWMGLPVLGGNPSISSLCPSGTGSNSNCVIDNASIRYDQLQGRFIVLFTVTDLPAHRSNWVLVVSTFAQFQKCPMPASPGSVCPTSSPLFTAPVIAPIVGGTQTGGVNGANWVLYSIPINLQYNQFQQPNALGLVNNRNAPPPFNTPLANSAVGTPNPVGPIGASTATFLTTPFCTNGGPSLPLTFGTVTSFGGTVAAPVLVTNGSGGSARTCTNYYPTQARMGIDNDNIILTAPVLDMAYSGAEGLFPTVQSANFGRYAGTRVTTVAKIQVYNGLKLNLTQPGPGGCTSDTPVDCHAVNLADNTATGTLSAVTQIVSFEGAAGAALQYGQNGLANSCVMANPGAVLSTLNANNIALSCAPVNRNPVLNGGLAPAFLGGVPGAPFTGTTFGAGNNYLPPVFWEPDNLRGRALASFDAQLAPFPTQQAGVITPIDYLVGTAIETGFAAGNFFVQPIIFTCPGIALFTGPAGVNYCGAGTNGAQSLVSDLPFLGPLFRNASSLTNLTDPAPVGQGFSAAQMTTSPANTPVTSTTNSRLFVGDSRPEQVIFREGLLYIARNGRTSDLASNFLGTSTVIYDILKTCAGAALNPACGSYSINGGSGNGNPGLTAPNTAFEFQWFNGTSVPDPSGNVNGFGFYAPMFDVPADVVAAGPVSPISTLQLFDKLFVGMTTGGTSNTLGTFSRNFPSLWDYRPGDDAFDTPEPYLDPYTGDVRNTVACANDVVVSVLSKSGNTITVADPSGVGVGMFLTTIGPIGATITGISGNLVTLSSAFTPTTFPASATFSRNQPVVSTAATLITPGSNKITVASTTGLAVGQQLASGPIAPATVQPPNGNAASVSTTAITTAGTKTIKVASTTNVGVGEVVTGGTQDVRVNLVNGSKVLSVPNTSQVAAGEGISGTGIPAGVTICPNPSCPAAPAPTLNGDGTIQVTLSAAATANLSNTTVTLNSNTCFPTAATAGTYFVIPPGPFNTNMVTVNYPVGCTSFGSDGTVLFNGLPINNGIPVTFSFNVDGTAVNPIGGTQPLTNAFPTGTTILSISGNTVTLSNSASNPLPGQAGPPPVVTANIPLNFVSAGTLAQASCPMIQWSSRGGAATDPNDGSLWLFGEFAKNRFSTVPGPGQWGTSVANYALSFPAVDAYGNDNTYFQDVQPTGSPDSAFFTWIQLAKNLGLAVPSATGPCTINNGNPPILQPSTSGTQPGPSPSTLGCPYFGPDTIVTRAEMAYWVVKSIMDETMITNYLCATGGDPSGLSPQCAASSPGSTFADVGAGGGSILNPFLGANASLNIAGVTNAQLMRYIEVMARRGITKGCNSTIDPTAAYCPNQPVTRAQMSVFLIRAKMDNVFPTTLSGIPLAAPYGDNFGTFLPPTPYFSDVTAADPIYGPYYIYIQKMRELRITNGTGGATFSPGQNLTRKEIAVFIVRAFFL